MMDVDVYLTCRLDLTRITRTQLELMDATRERMVGRAEVPMFALLQRNADALFRPPSSLDRRRKQQKQQRGAGDEEEDHEEEEEEEEQMLPLRCVLFWG